MIHLTFSFRFCCCYSVAKSCLTLQPHGLQHTRLSCPSLSSPNFGVCQNSCPLSWWCHQIISFSLTPFSSCPRSFPASGSFPLSWLFTSGGRSIGTSASASVLPTSIQGWFPFFRIYWFDPLAIQGTLKSLLQQHSSKASILRHLALFTVQLSHPYMASGKTIALTRQTFVSKVMSLLFNMLSRFVITSWQIDGETMETVTDFLFLGSRITADRDCSHEIKRCLLLRRKAMTNLELSLGPEYVFLAGKLYKPNSQAVPSVLLLRVAAGAGKGGSLLQHSSR